MANVGDQDQGLSMELPGRAGGGLLTGRSLGSRIKGGIDVNELVTKGGVTFEVEDGSDEPFDLDSLDDEGCTDVDLLMTDFEHLSTVVNDKPHDSIYKSIDAEEAIGQFDNLVEKMESITDDGKVKKLVVKKGTGKRIPEDSRVWFDYIAFAEGQDSPYDSTLSRGFPEVVTLNDCGCVLGLKMGLKSMEYGEIAKFWIHYDYAYGKFGSPPRIPAEACVVLTVELRQVATAEDLKSCLFMSPDERNCLPVDEIIKAADDLRTAGNGFYVNNSHREAIKRYRKALDLLENYTTASRTDDAKRNDLAFTIYTNLAQTYLKVSLPAKACTACKAALHLPPHKLAYKLLFRYAEAKFDLGDKEGAWKQAREAIAKAPKKIPELEEFLNKVEASINKDITSESTMYRKMFGGT